MDAPSGIDPDLITAYGRVLRPFDGGLDLLRQVHVELEYDDGSSTTSLGHVSGWIAWNFGDESLQEAGDAVNADAEALGAAADDIVESRPNAWIDSVLMVDRMFLEPEYRGNRMARTMLRSTLDLFRLLEAPALVVLCPEPQLPDGGPMEDGPERDAAMARLCAAYAASGLEPWAGSETIWWLLMADM